MPSNEGKFLGPDFMHCFDAPVVNFVVSLIQYPSYFGRQEQTSCQGLCRRLHSTIVSFELICQKEDLKLAS